MSDNPQLDGWTAAAILTMCVIAIFILGVLSSGCMTAAKQAIADMRSTPTPTPEPVINTTIEPTPEPTMRLIEFDTGMKPYQFVSWRRDNVSGLKDLNMHATIYGYSMYKSVQWWSVSWGKYFTQSAPDGMKYLFVYAYTYSDEGSARTWGIQPHQFYVSAGGQLYKKSDDLLPQIRLKEFDEVWNFRHVENLKPYGYLRSYDKEGRETAEELAFLKSGQSNAWDGYIVYVIPETTKPEDIRIYATLTNTLDGVFWKLQ